MKEIIIVCFMIIATLNQPLFCMRSGSSAKSSPALDIASGGLEGLVTALRGLNEKPAEEYQALQELRAYFCGLAQGHLSYAMIVSWGVCWDNLEKIMHVGVYTDGEKELIKKNIHGLQFLAGRAHIDTFNPRDICALFGMADPREEA